MYNISLRPDEAMFEWHDESLFMITKIVLLMQYKEFYNINWIKKQN